MALEPDALIGQASPVLALPQALTRQAVGLLAPTGSFFILVGTMTQRQRTKDAQWESLFALPDKPALPLQQRLRLSVVQAILDGRLPAGALLPSSRELAQVLGLSRNTVTAAYAHLLDDGFIESRPRSGVFVTDNAQAAASKPLALGAGRGTDAAEAKAEALAGAAQPDWQSRVLRSLSDQRTLAKPDQWRRYAYPFVYGTYDPQLFPSEAFRECCVHSLARAHLPHWTPDFELSDVPELVEQIRLRLLPKRGVFALPEEILITVGAQHAYYLLAEALFDENQRVGLEEPGHPHARNSFATRHPQCLPLAAARAVARVAAAARAVAAARIRRRCRTPANPRVCLRMESPPPSLPWTRGLTWPIRSAKTDPVYLLPSGHFPPMTMTDLV